MTSYGRCRDTRPWRCRDVEMGRWEDGKRDVGDVINTGWDDLWGGLGVGGAFAN